MLSVFGLVGLLLAFFGSLLGAVALAIGQRAQAKGSSETAEVLLWAGRAACLIAFLGLTLSCAILVYAFMAGNFTIQYVLDNYSRNAGELGWMYKLSGLWAGREGSLLFWAWLISLFAFIVSRKGRENPKRLDSVALMVLCIVLLAFVGVLLFSEDNMPFIATDEKYFDYATGQVTTSGSVLGMSSMLEHWAMAIHPPTLFLGYAGLTVPFAYALAALVCNDASVTWVERATPYALFSWLLLTVGIGLGAIWAYVCLGWGGYWGWDPVENASLLSWLMCIALVHSFTVYRQRRAFKGWSIMCAAFTFCFVIVGTFISRSGLVQSVHAFEGDTASTVLFLLLIVLSVLLAAVGLVYRRKTFEPEVVTEAESMLTKDVAYYVNCVFVLLATVLLCYMTISSVLPSFMPYGGQSVSTGTYNAIARPLGIVYLALVAIGPLLGWAKTGKTELRRRLKVPTCIALVIFAVLMAYFACVLLPAYNATVAAGDSTAEALLEMGPSWYYNGLAVVGFAVASILMANAVCMMARCIKAGSKRLAPIGGSLAHAAMGLMLVGLIGSSMYVTEQAGYLDYDSETDTSTGTFAVGSYELTYTSQLVEEMESSDVLYQVSFDVANNGAQVGSVSSSVQLVVNTQQQKLNAGLLHFPTEDLFVVYKGVSSKTGDLSLDVRVNPLIGFVWAGFALLCCGMLASFVGTLRQKRLSAKEVE